MKILPYLFSSALLLSITACAGTQPQRPAQDARGQAMRGFATEMARKHGFQQAELEQLLGQARFRDDIIQAISRPAEAKPWYQYRPIFLKPDRIQGGAEFWREHSPLLRQVEAQYGVPAQIIVAIIGVETRYGRHTGRYPVLDSLTTLAFGYPTRGRFFRSELEQFLLLSREERIDPRQAKGSYAGAMGKPQFIASSYRRYAVDQDQDGRRDLWNDDADVIASVANYFKVHGWRPGEAITQPLELPDGVDEQGLEPLVEAGMKPSIPLSRLLADGLRPHGGPTGDPDTLASLIKLDAGDHNEYWLGLHNFYVITRYNHSNLYAMAAYQLSQEILAARDMAGD